MNAGNANLLNAVTMIIMSIWGYKVGGSPTALGRLCVASLLVALRPCCCATRYCFGRYRSA